MKKNPCFAYALCITLFILLCGQCSLQDNPADPGAENFAGFLTVASAAEVKPEIPAAGENYCWTVLYTSLYPGALHYRVQIAAAPGNFNGAVVYDETFTSNVIRLSHNALAGNTRYYWRVCVQDSLDDSWCGWSAISDFYLPGIKEETLYPASGQPVTAGAYLQWETMNDQPEYELSIREPGQTWDEGLLYLLAEGCFAIPPALAVEKEYYWSVRVYGADGKRGAATLPRSFYLLNSPVSGNAGIPVPTGFSVAYQEGTVYLNWDSNPDVDYYRIFRGTEVSNLQDISGSLYAVAAFADNNFPHIEKVLYGIKSAVGQCESLLQMQWLSLPAGNLRHQVRRLTASLLQYAGKICLNWEAVPEADSYIIYRYANSSEPAVFTRRECLLNYYDDVMDVLPAAFFYRVAFSRNGIEQGLSEGFVPGACAAFADPGEPFNNDFPNSAEGQGTALYEMHKSFLYSFPAAGNAALNDCDWYKCTTTSPVVSVDFTMTGDAAGQVLCSPDINLYFQFVCQNHPYPAVPVTQGQMNFVFNDFVSRADNPGILYFRIYAENSGVGSMLLEYSICITDEF